MVPLPPLHAPVWERQPSEAESEFQAFREWLCGSPRGELRDWHHVTHVTGLGPEALRALSQRWVWEIRANEYQAHARNLSDTALAPLRESVAALQAKRLGYVHDLAEWVAVETKKHLNSAKASGASLASMSEIVRVARVLELASLALQRQADGLPAITGEAEASALDWNALTPQELELHRQLRAKAARRA